MIDTAVNPNAVHKYIDRIRSEGIICSLHPKSVSDKLVWRHALERGRITGTGGQETYILPCCLFICCTAPGTESLNTGITQNNTAVVRLKLTWQG